MIIGYVHGSTVEVEVVLLTYTMILVPVVMDCKMMTQRKIGLRLGLTRWLELQMTKNSQSIVLTQKMPSLAPR